MRARACFRATSCPSRDHDRTAIVATPRSVNLHNDIIELLATALHNRTPHVEMTTSLVMGM